MPSTVRPRFLPMLAAVATAGLLAAPAAAQFDLSSVEVTAEHVAGSVHMLTGAGGNIGVLVGEDGVLIVDDQFAPLADKIRAAIAGISPGDLEFVINTHFHGDHTGGNAIFGEEALIVAHSNVRKRLAAGDGAGGQPGEAAPKVALPVVTYDIGVSIHFNDEQIMIGHLDGGHTDGDSYVYFMDSNVIHLGDQFFSGAFPFVDVASGGNAVGLRDSVGGVLDRLPEDAMVIPGHGPLSTVDDLRAYHRMLTECVATVQAGKDAGKSIEDIQAAGLPDEWEGWGSGFINEAVFVGFIYASL
ncbi:MAG: MBL fold metallo-hydrolase [Acidobacteriota bacterium]|nr:MBL fold metallo-hydrolase [Acidobacteriota bacterium]MDE2921992.1 MBL fold metallo-hydrolase [Acidobacteriota bacterium]MDE3265756.1 MBL fold metallo-hydrolase [Acidobacteriota bacterium]